MLANVAVKQLVAKLDAAKREALGVDSLWLVEKHVAVFEKAFEGAPKVWKGEPVYVVDDDGRRAEVREWSPSGCNEALKNLARLVGATVERSVVDVGGEVVFVLTLDRDLSEEGDGE